MQAVILAGGLATRMRPLTTHTPKALLEVAGRPFIDWLLEKLASCGFRDVLLCTGYLGERIEAHAGDGARLGLRVRYSNEGDTRLGTAGALRHALPLLSPAFLVSYGDSYLPFDYGEPLRLLAEHQDCDGVMSVYHNKNQWDASNVITDGEWVLRYEKGATAPAFEHIDYGAIALRREIVEALPPGLRGGLEAIQGELAAKKRLRACVARDRFFEIGSLAGLTALDQHLKDTP